MGEPYTNAAQVTVRSLQRLEVILARFAESLTSDNLNAALNMSLFVPAPYIAKAEAEPVIQRHLQKRCCRLFLGRSDKPADGNLHVVIHHCVKSPSAECKEDSVRLLKCRCILRREHYGITLSAICRGEYGHLIRLISATGNIQLYFAPIELADFPRSVFLTYVCFIVALFQFLCHPLYC